jgi:hypothetical protein
MGWTLRAVRQHLAARNIAVTHDGAYANGEPRLIAYKQGGALGDSVHAPDAETLYVRALRRLT